MTSREEKLREIALRFEQKRTRADEACEDRKKALAERFEEYKSILEEKLSYGEKILLAMQGTPEQAQAEIARLAEEHRALRRREAEFLRSQNLPENYLTVQYECAHCEDTGYLPGGRMCECLIRERNRIEAYESGLFSLFEKQTFETFSPQRTTKKGVENMTFCREYAEGFDPETSTNLLFLGGTGVGKTHLSSAIGRVVLEAGHRVVYESTMQALTFLEGERFRDEKPETNRLLQAELLILDDLGTELPGKSTASFLYYLINTRLVTHKPTILSTNLSAQEIESRYDQRLFSRLTGEYEILLFDGTDQRGNE